MSKPIAPRGMTCPLRGKDVSKVCHTCEWYTRVVGKAPQSEEIIDKWGCAISWLPMLTIENSQRQHQTAAEIGELRNIFGEGMRRARELRQMNTTQQGRLDNANNDPA